MAAIGYTLSCEEFGPRALTAQAVRAERAGFDFAGISDHYHPWVDKQGNSPFVWGVLGAEEAIEVIRRLWEGGLVTHYGRHFTVENARLYTLPEAPPPVLVAVAGKRSVDLAARLGDGLVGTAPKAESVEEFRAQGGEGPAYGQLHVCWAESEQKARQTALEYWPNGAISGSHFLELPLPSHFEEATELADEDAIAESIVCGPDPEKHLEAIRKFLDAGYDHVYVHQVGPEQDGFFDFYERSVLPALSD